MEKDIEMIKKQNKNQKILFITFTIIILFIFLICGYFLFTNNKANVDYSNGIGNKPNSEINNKPDNEVNTKPNNENNNKPDNEVNTKPNNENNNKPDDETNTKPNNNIPTQVYDITSTGFVKQLHKQLTFEQYGLYFSDKQDISNIGKQTVLQLVLVKFLNEKGYKLSFLDFCSSETGINISKEEFNQYIEKNYNTKLDYNKIENDYIFLRGLETAIFEEKNIKYCMTLMTGGISFREELHNKIIKAELRDDLIYIYDMVVYCEGSSDRDYKANCYNVIDYRKDKSNSLVYSCLQQNSLSYCENNVPNNVSYAELSNYLLNNMKDKLYTFKHTFKKGTDGNYYWVSSEISK